MGTLVGVNVKPRGDDPNKKGHRVDTAS